MGYYACTDVREQSVHRLWRSWADADPGCVLYVLSSNDRENLLTIHQVGAIIFGLAADRYGRKWPFIVNLILFIVLELGTGFTYSYESFLGVRALYGIAMGGLYGNAAATAIEDCPERARGIISGMLQQGYAFGYLLATAFARGLVDTTPHGWRPLYWFGAAVPVLIIAFRLCEC